MKPKFSTLIILTLLSAAILAPFAVSSIYIPLLREKAFTVLLFLQDNLYKQITGYIALTFVILEMVLTARKRGRGWMIKITIPGSMQFWRSLHIFLGVGLLSIVLIHTVGSTGSNFNAIFLWVFFAVSLSALLGVVAEAGVLESSQKRFLTQKTPDGKTLPGITKGNMIKGMRAFWLNTHIILVSIFFVMLGFHIFLAYFYQ
ncbi:MAG TPA: hypothetical protein ACFCUY_10955 [Xenococcaceae cyanobacterium]|jgi:hypothetical protein